MTAVTAPFLPQPPHDLAVSRFVDNVRRSPLRAKSRLDNLYDPSEQSSFPLFHTGLR